MENANNLEAKDCQRVSFVLLTAVGMLSPIIKVELSKVDSKESHPLHPPSLSILGADIVSICRGPRCGLWTPAVNRCGGNRCLFIGALKRDAALRPNSFTVEE